MQVFRGCTLACFVSRGRGPEFDAIRLIVVDLGHCFLPRRTADARLRRHRRRQSPTNAPRQRADRVNQKLQQAVRVQRLPDQREGELQHLVRGPKRRIVLETGPRKADALQRIVQNDAVAARHDNGLRRIVDLAQHLRRGLGGHVPRECPDNDQGAVAAERSCLVAGQQRLELAEIRIPRCATRTSRGRGAVEAFKYTPPKGRQVVRRHREVRPPGFAYVVCPAG